MVALLLAALCTACASAPQRIACRGVAVSAPAPAGPFPAYVEPPTRKDALVFVHGLGGDAVKAWTNRSGVYWPRVAANDPELADYDVYVYAYETNPTGQCLGIPDLATQMRTRLASDRVFETHDRVIFVSHSLGGLVVREMLTTFDELIPKTLLLFYATPGHGAELARWASMITGCQQVHDLRPEELNSHIRGLNNIWKHRISRRVRSRCAIEGIRYQRIRATSEAGVRGSSL
jgi:pimeloyl-ACP methyl ester carboxylesterase